MTVLAGNRLSPNHPPPRQGPIEGPSVWYGAKLKNSSEWAYTLSGAERNEVIDAMRHARSRHDDIANMTKADFPMPGFASRLESLRREVMHGRGFVLLRNFPVEDFSFEEVATMYWGFDTYIDGRLVISYLRQLIDDAQELPEVGPHDPELVEALDLMTELAEDPELYLSMDFAPGDIQLLHNHQILHNRTAYEDWPEADRKRYLLRLWLSPPDGLQLPDAFAERYGSVTPGDRGGVVVKGTERHVPLTAL